MTTHTSKITIQSIGFKSSRKLSGFVRKHIAKLELMSDRIIEIRVSLRLDASVVGSSHACDISVLMPGKDLFVSKKTSSFEESVTLAVDALKHQLEHWKSSVAG